MVRAPKVGVKGGDENNAKGSKFHDKMTVRNSPPKKQGALL